MTTQAQRLQSLNDAKFGLFIHWAPYTLLGGEYRDRKSDRTCCWIQQAYNIPADEYEAVARQMNPVKFDADAWVHAAKNAGMRYIVAPAKHHDGFCMFDTAHTDYNIVKFTPFRRDPIKELAEACARHDMKLGIYYSIPDWHHPEFPTRYSNSGLGFHGRPNPKADVAKYADYQIAQIRELLTNYGPIFILWFDGGDAFKDEPRYELLKGDELIGTIRRLQPDCLINDRLRGGDFDYGTPEQYVPGTIQEKPFEVCMTMNNCWGWNKFDHNWKSESELLHLLLDIAHKGGNWLLNVGPTPEGIFPEPCITRLRFLGDWLRRNGEAYYGTRNSLFATLPWGRSTTRPRDNGGCRVYLHVFDWPQDGQLTIPGLRTLPERAWLLKDGSGGTPMAVTRVAEGVSLSVPTAAPESCVAVVVLDFGRMPDIVQPEVAKAPDQAGQAAT